MKKCCKYIIKNVGSELATYNFVKCDDSVQYVQEALFPDETKEVFCFEDTLVTAFNTVEFLTGCDGIIAPSKTPAATPTNTPTFTQTPTFTPSQTTTPTFTPTMTQTPTTTPPVIAELTLTIEIDENETNHLVRFSFIGDAPIALDVDWGDTQGTKYLLNSTIQPNHTYSVGGRYYCKIRVYFANFISVLQFNSSDNGSVYNNITQVQGLNSLTNLQELNLGENKISDVNNIFPLPQSLLYFSLDGNLLKTFEPLTPLPSNLYGIYLNNNLIKKFDPTLPLPSNLFNLGLAYNLITEFNPTNSLPEFLYALYLDGNQISYFNPTEPLPPNLGTLTLARNQIITFDYEGLPDSLRTLVLSDNGMTSFNMSSFPTNLEQLILEKNNLSTFDYNFISNSLRILLLNENSLSYFTGLQLFSTLPQNFQTLRLENNQIDSNTLGNLLIALANNFPNPLQSPFFRNGLINLKQEPPSIISPSIQPYIDILTNSQFEVLVDT